MQPPTLLMQPPTIPTQPPTLWELGKLEKLEKLEKLTGAMSVPCKQFQYYSYNATTRSWLCSSIAKKINYCIYNLYIHYDTKCNVPTLLTKYRAATVADQRRRGACITSRTGRRARMSPACRMIADEQPVRVGGQQEEW